MITNEALIERVEQLRYRAPEEIDALIARFAIVPVHLQGTDLTEVEGRALIIPCIPQMHRGWFWALIDELTTI